MIADNYRGAFHATEHLFYQGFKKTAHITSSPYLSITAERLKGYRDALEKHNLSYNENLVKYCTHGGMITDEVEDALDNLFKGKVKPDALFTAGDRLTTVCLALLKRMKPKKDVGFTGFTNSQVGDLFSPSLTVVQQPAFEIGQVVTELLIQMIESKRPVTTFETRRLETNLVIRESSLKKAGINDAPASSVAGES